jgi:hypothetical protein
VGADKVIHRGALAIKLLVIQKSRVTGTEPSYLSPWLFGICQI